MDWNIIPTVSGESDFNDLLTVLDGGVPSRPTLFEFFMNERIYRRVVPGFIPQNLMDGFRRRIQVFHRLGYDFATILIPGFQFTDPETHQKKESISLNEGHAIRTQDDMDTFQWPDPADADYGILDLLGRELPLGMKLIPYSPDGVLENVIRLMGYSDLCYNLVDRPKLVGDLFEQVGYRLIQYYKKLVRYDCVGACLVNDDWGFKTSTLLSPQDLRRLVFPWYKQIVDICHAKGKPVILHSCGFAEEIMDDVINEIKFDGKHSFEDTIMSVEEVYKKYGNRIAIMGGIDVDFICHATPEEVYARSKAMLDQSNRLGGFALGTGNSVPEYIPDQNYFAMIRAALDQR